MTYTVYDPGDLTDAVITRLASQTGKQISKAEAPADQTTPYAVVYPLDDFASSGGLNDPDREVWWERQVTCVGSDATEAEWMQQKCRAALLGWAPTITGITASPVQLGLGSGVRRDPPDVAGEYAFTTGDIFRVFTSPT